MLLIQDTRRRAKRLAHIEEKKNIITALLTLKTCFNPPLKKKTKKQLLVTALLSEDKNKA